MYLYRVRCATPLLENICIYVRPTYMAMYAMPVLANVCIYVGPTYTVYSHVCNANFSEHLHLCRAYPYSQVCNATFSESIGVNHPAIVREIPHFSLFPAFPHFLENVPHFWLYFEKQKIPENLDNSWRQKEFLCVILVSH